MTIHLSVEEALDYQKFEAELTGFSAGVNAALDYMRRRRIDAIMQARKVTESAAPATDQPKTEEL
jgi:hypothetical protein